MVTKDNLLSRLELADKGQIIAKGLKSFVRDVNKRANLEKEQYGRDAILNDQFYPNGRPRYTQDAFERLSDDERKQKLEEAHAFRVNKSMVDAVNDFRVNPEEALKEADKYSSKLVDIILEKGVIGEAPTEKQEIISAGAGYISYKKLKEDLESGKAIHGENEKQLRELASRASADIMYNHLEGYPEELRKLGAQYAALASSEITRDNMIVGANKLIDETRNELIKKYGNDFEDKLAEAVGSTLVKLVKSSDAKKEQIAVDLFYKAHKGYSIGERDFLEVYV